jgi:hypothetical protein
MMMPDGVEAYLRSSHPCQGCNGSAINHRPISNRYTFDQSIPPHYFKGNATSNTPSSPHVNFRHRLISFAKLICFIGFAGNTTCTDNIYMERQDRVALPENMTWLN